MKLKTVRVRRSNPSALALALALMLTMLCVYLLSLSALPEKTADTAAVSSTGSADIRMEGMEVAFLLYARSPNQLEARVLAARCADAGGAGMILDDGGSYCIIREAADPDSAGKDDLLRSAAPLTLKLRGASGEITAVSDAVDFLRSLATETGGLPASVKKGDTDLDSVCSLFSVYRTRGQKALNRLNAILPSNPIIAHICSAVQANLDRLDETIAAPDSGKIKLVHAAACGEWLSLLDTFAASAAEPA